MQQLDSKEKNLEDFNYIMKREGSYFRKLYPRKCNVCGRIKYLRKSRHRNMCSECSAILMKWRLPKFRKGPRDLITGQYIKGERNENTKRD